MNNDPGTYEPDWLADTDTTLLVIRRYDEDDILIGHQYFMLLQDQSDDDRFIVSSVARSLEPERIPSKDRQ